MTRFLLVQCAFPSNPPPPAVATLPLVVVDLPVLFCLSRPFKDAPLWEDERKNLDKLREVAERRADLLGNIDSERREAFVQHEMERALRYRELLRNAKTPAEREKILQTHKHNQVREDNVGEETFTHTHTSLFSLVCTGSCVQCSQTSPASGKKKKSALVLAFWGFADQACFVL